MSLQSHLSELERRHEALDRELAESLASLSSPDERIADIKRRKLQLKDEIARLKATTRSVH